MTVLADDVKATEMMKLLAVAAASGAAFKATRVDVNGEIAKYETKAAGKAFATDDKPRLNPLVPSILCSLRVAK